MNRQKLNLLNFFCLENRFALQTIVSRNLKLRYRKSILGALWTVLIPLSMASIYYFVFQVVLKIKVENYLLLLLAKLLPWTFFSTALSSGIESFVSNHGILNKVPISPNIFTLADIATAFLNLVLSAPALLILVLVYSWQPSLQSLWAVPMLLLLLIQGYCWALILATYLVFFRDLRHILSIVLQGWFYCTPILYAPEMVPSNFRYLMNLNPVYGIFSTFHSSITHNQASNADLIAAVIWSSTIFIVAVRVYYKNVRLIVEKI